MKKVLSAGFAIVLLASLSMVWAPSTFAAAATGESLDKPAGSVTESSEITATVKSLDVKKRKVVIADADGNTMVINVKPDVKNLDRMKVGDTVRMQYTQTVSLHVRSAQSGPSASAETSSQVNPGSMPNKTLVNQAEFVAKVISIDQKKRLVTLVGPQGNEETYEISKQAKKLKNVKAGDEVVVQIKETLAVSVEAVEKE